MVNSCDSCDKVVSFDEDYNQDFVVRQDYFHEPCASCDRAEYQSPDLCAWCKHLRLRHLVKCVKVHDVWPRPHFYMKRGLLADQTITNCSLCRLFRHILLSMSHRLSLELLAECCMELSLGDTAESIRGWFTSNKVDDMVGPMFYVSDEGDPDILPLVTENISWESLREGIDYCLERHIACRNEHALELPPGFRVIDIEKQCISTVQSQTCDFFALSYVWGKDDSPHSKITTENYAALSIPGALSRIQLPQTVQDAMTACAQLGRRDLWCDRLCIIQDDPEDKANQIAAMDRIYRSAQYVIVAYGSENMHSGMSGISRARPQTQMRVQLAGLVVTSDAFDDFCDHNFKGCAYLERGWTYQEYELARRKLCFRNTQAFLACRHGRKEEYHRGFGDNGDENQTARPLAPLFSQYTSHVEIYSGRRLSFYSDAIAAIAGVLQWLYEDKGEIVCGLPVIHFDKALLWYHEADNLNRPPNIGFPMWSWASSLGGCGKIKFQDALWRGIARLRAFEFCGTFVPWYALDAYGSVRPVNVVADYEPYERWKTYIAIAHEAGCVANMIHRQKGSVHWSDYNSYVRQVVPLELDTTGPPIPKLLSLETHIPRKHVLLTLTQTASLAWKLSSSDTHWGVQLLSHVGAKIGEVAVPLEDRSQYEQLPVQWTKDVEVIGISLAVMTAPGENAGLSASQCVDVDGQDFPDIPIVNVLVIERFGIFARRKYLGWVCFDDWARFERTWEYILLV